MEINKFIIITTQRTVSTYLRLCLNNYPKIISYGEISMPEFSKKKNSQIIFYKNQLNINYIKMIS